jgi:hypothetical protein
MSSQDTRDKKKSKGKKKAPDGAVVDTVEEYSGSESSDESRGDDDDEGTGPEGPGDDNGGGGGDEEEAKSDYSDVDEDLAYTFVGLDKKLWAKECPNPKGVQFVKEALKQALQVNEVEEGASRIVMDFMESTDGDGEGGGGASRLSGILGPTERNGMNNAFGTASRPSMERIPSTSASAAAGGTPRGQERQPQQKMTEEEGTEEGRKAAEEFMMMKKRLEEKVMERIDADNEKNPVYKMLLKDEKVIDHRILVTVELIKYLRWLKKKLVN